jgi:hypothetical protein
MARIEIAIAARFITASVAAEAGHDRASPASQRWRMERKVTE